MFNANARMGLNLIIITETTFVQKVVHDRTPMTAKYLTIFSARSIPAYRSAVKTRFEYRFRCVKISRIMNCGKK